MKDKVVKWLIRQQANTPVWQTHLPTDHHSSTQLNTRILTQHPYPGSSALPRDALSIAGTVAVYLWTFQASHTLPTANTS
jgi:hypothetical protein